MEKRIIELRTLKPGRYILIEDCACKITNMTHSKPGKHGGARVRVEGVDIFEGSKKSIIKPASDKVETPVLQKGVAQVLAIVGTKLQLMDMESYETYDMPMPDDPEITPFIKDGAEVMTMSFDGKKRITQVKGGGV